MYFCIGNKRFTTMKRTIYKRKLYDKMLAWKRESDGHTALLIKGARRVGKTTLALEFARNEYETFISIDFSIASDDIKELFSHIDDMNYFFLRLQSLYGVSLYARKSVIIFDEVQLFPRARQAIKHLVSDHRYDYIETGSLLSIKKNVKDILIPSEETRLSLYPMDFEEFMTAVGKAPSLPVIDYAFNSQKALGDAVNRHLMRDFRLYMLVGGMPQAVETYLRTNDFSAVDAVKRNILELYIDDFRKIDPTGKSSRLFVSIPSELSRNTSRYKIGSVIANATASRISEQLMDMADSMTVNFAFRCNDPSVGLSLNADPSCFKLFLADTGLFVTLAFMDRDYTENVIYKKLLSDKLPVNMGYVYENMAAQMLKSAGNELFYYTFKEEIEVGDGKKKTRYYGVDFLLSRGDKLCPIEVKSSGYSSHRSLDKFFDKFSDRISRSYILHTKDLRVADGIICLPIYMADML